jgi:hypothetical protein
MSEPNKAKLRSFNVDFEACVADNCTVHMSRVVQAKDVVDAGKVCHNAVAKDYGRTAWCMAFRALGIKEV